MSICLREPSVRQVLTGTAGTDGSPERGFASPTFSISAFAVKFLADRDCSTRSTESDQQKTRWPGEASFRGRVRTCLTCHTRLLCAVSFPCYHRSCPLLPDRMGRMSHAAPCVRP